MANYSITINSKFRPFSFQELMTPLMMMEQNHREVEEQYANLMTESAKWENLANEQTDKIAYNQYKRYALDLELAADKLAKEGITANSRPSMYKLKSRYNSEIAPIELAYNLRAADIKAQREEEKQKGANMVFTERAATKSLDDYLNGKPLQYESLNLTEVSALASEGAKNISSRYFNTYEGQRFSQDYIRMIKANGINPNDIQGQNQVMEMLRRSGKYPELEKFYNDLKGSYQTDKYSEKDQMRINNALDMGINMGIVYKQEEQYLEDKERAFQRDMALIRARGDEDRKTLMFKAGLEGNEDNIASKTMSFLQTSGEESNIYNIVNKLFTENGGYKQGYFGAKGTLNPMKIYKEVERYAAAHPVTSEITTGDNLAFADTPGLARSAAARRVENDKQASWNAAKNAISKKYGGIYILSKDEYNTLSKLGYNEKSKLSDWGDAPIKANKYAAKHKHISVNLPEEGLDVLNTSLTAGANMYEKQLRSTSNLVWEIGKDGTAGKPKKPSDYFDLDDINKNKLQDIYYSEQESDKLHVVINGNHLYVSPSIFNNDAISSAVSWGNSLLSKSDEAIKNYYVEQGADPSKFDADDARAQVKSDVNDVILAAARGYNKGRSKIDSKE